MWRATRLVVDTGIHAKGWSKQQAVDYMLDNTALSAANIDAARGLEFHVHHFTDPDALKPCLIGHGLLGSE